MRWFTKLGILLVIVLGGCSEADRAELIASESSTLVDDTGRTVVLPESVDRVAVAASFAADYLAMLGHLPVLRPDTPLDDSATADVLEPIATVAVDHSVGPNIEQIAAADPDLVVLSPSFSRFAETIESAAETVVVVFRIASLDDVAEKAKHFGRMVNQLEAGEALASRLSRQIKDVAAPDNADPPTVYAMFGTPASNFAFLPASYLGSMVEHLGAGLITDGSPASQMSTQLAPFSFEALVEADPDVILMVHHGPAGQLTEALAERPAWASLKAVRNGRVHRVSERLFMTNPGPSAVAALEVLRDILYPEASDDPGR